MKTLKYENQPTTQNFIMHLTAQLMRKHDDGHVPFSRSTFNITNEGDAQLSDFGNEAQFLSIQNPIAFIKNPCAISFTLQYLLEKDDEITEQKAENITLPLPSNIPLVIAQPVPRNIYNRDDLYVLIDTDLSAHHSKIPFTHSMHNPKPATMKKIALMLRLIKENNGEYKQYYHCKVMCDAIQDNMMEVTARHHKYDIDASDYPKDAYPLEIFPLTYDQRTKLISAHIFYHRKQDNGFTKTLMNIMPIPLDWNSSMEWAPGVYVRIDAHEEKEATIVEKV